MTRPIPDKAEVALEFPDKLYIGTFERSARFEAHLDQTGVSLTLHRAGAADVRKSVHMHFHYGLFADILSDLANTVASMRPDDADHREALRTAAEALYRAFEPKGHAGGSEPAKLNKKVLQENASELTRKRLLEPTDNHKVVRPDDLLAEGEFGAAYSALTGQVAPDRLVRRSVHPCLPPSPSVRDDGPPGPSGSVHLRRSRRLKR
jgi:hypothetical protein